MTTWTVKLHNRTYAEFEFDKYLKLIWMSDQTRIDNLPGKLDQEWDIFDPRNLGMRMIKKPKDIYDADLYLAAIFLSDNWRNENKYTIETGGLDWSKVLEKDIPGRVY